jgi:hypothetical protein
LARMGKPRGNGHRRSLISRRARRNFSIRRPDLWTSYAPATRRRRLAVGLAKRHPDHPQPPRTWN